MAKQIIWTCAPPLTLGDKGELLQDGCVISGGAVTSALILCQATDGTATQDKFRVRVALDSDPTTMSGGQIVGDRVVTLAKALLTAGQIASFESHALDAFDNPSDSSQSIFTPGGP